MKFRGIRLIYLVVLLIGVSGCSTVASQIEKVSKDRSAYVVCIDGRAWLYGGGNVIIVGVKKSFFGYVIADSECNVNIAKLPIEEEKEMLLW